MAKPWKKRINYNIYSLKIKQSNVTHVLLTGGVGSRLWPLSRKSRPKQYLKLFSKKSLFQLAVKRNLNFADSTMVVGNNKNMKLSQEDLEDLSINEYSHIVETVPRNTAAAIAFAAFASKKNDILLVTPADHLISGDKAYERAIEKAILMAHNEHIVTFGIKPTKAETGYGYLEVSGENEVKSFREKPNLDTARSFVDSGNFLWNSGMFCFKASVYLQELEKLNKEVFEASKKAFDKREKGVIDSGLSLKIPSVSVDYAVMEKTDKIKVVKSDFEWSDMGSFEAVYDFFESKGYPVDEHKNMTIGDAKPTFFLGLENAIFVHTEEANLILQKECSQGVKNLYSFLEENEPKLVN